MKDNKIVLRIAPFLAVLFLFMGAFLIWGGISIYSPYKPFERTDTSFRERNYSRLPSEARQSLEDAEIRMGFALEKIEESRKRAHLMTTASSGFLVIFGVFFLSQILYVRIIISGDYAHAYLFPLRSVNLSQIPPVKLSSVKKILIVRGTPLDRNLPTKEKITWRDKVEVDGNVTVAFPGFIFSRLGIFIQEIEKANPNVKIDYYKSTLADNMRKYSRRFL